MNSLATLPPGQTALTPASLAFYATVATVIPVLFLAIAVQGPAYQNMLRASVTAVRSQPGARRPRRVLGHIASWLLLATAYVILLSAVFGEIEALLPMYVGTEAAGTRVGALLPTLLLLLATVTGPTVALAKAFRVVLEPATRHARPPDAPPDNTGTWE